MLFKLFSLLVTKQELDCRAELLCLAVVYLGILFVLKIIFFVLIMKETKDDVVIRY